MTATLLGLIANPVNQLRGVSWGGGGGGVIIRGQRSPTSFNVTDDQ